MTSRNGIFKELAADGSAVFFCEGETPEVHNNGYNAFMGCPRILIDPETVPANIPTFQEETPKSVSELPRFYRLYRGTTLVQLSGWCTIEFEDGGSIKSMYGGCDALISSDKYKMIFS